MIGVLKNLKGARNDCASGLVSELVSARVVDGALILSCPNAVTPVVWQMDLKDVKASALEVLAHEESGDFALVFKKPKGEPLEAAVFATREEAVAGLMAASQALETVPGAVQEAAPAVQARSAAGVSSGASHVVQEKKGAARWIITALCLLLLMAVWGLWNSIVMQSPRSFQQFPAGQAGVPQTAGGAGANTSGVPMSADDFLSNR